MVWWESGIRKNERWWSREVTGLSFAPLVTSIGWLQKLALFRSEFATMDGRFAPYVGVWRKVMGPLVPCDSLEEVRAHIDALDRRIVVLLRDRGALVSQAARFKRTTEEVHAPSRVEQVVCKVRAEATTCGADPEIVEATYRAMITAFIQMEMGECAASGNATKSAGFTDQQP